VPNHQDFRQNFLFDCDLDDEETN